MAENKKVGLWERTKDIATTYTGTFIVVMILNQLLFFGFCLNPICLIAAMPHVLLITVVVGSMINKIGKWGDRGLAKKTINNVGNELERFGDTLESASEELKDEVQSVHLELSTEEKAKLREKHRKALEGSAGERLKKVIPNAQDLIAKDAASSLRAKLKEDIAKLTKDQDLIAKDAASSLRAKLKRDIAKMRRDLKSTQRDTDDSADEEGAQENFNQANKNFQEGNDKEVFESMRQSAEQGSADDQFNLGWWYYREQGVTQNYTEAVKWFSKAAEQDYPEAQEMLDEIHHGSWIADELLEGSVDAGCAQANYDQAIAYFKKGNYKGAIKWLMKSSEQGLVEAHYNLGAMYANGKGVIQCYEEAAKWYRKSAELGFAEAQCNLGGMFYEGQGVPQNNKEAFKWMKKAAEQGHAEAQCNLGTMYGTVKSDHGEALKWYKKAADQGHVPGQERFDGLSDILEKYKSVGSGQQAQPIFDEEKALCDFVEKTNHSEFLFRDIFNDLDDAVEARADQINSIDWPDWPSLMLMAYGYAIRTATAALYMQGLLRKDQYVHVKDVFIALQIKTGGTVTFQEQAFTESVKFVAGYNPTLTISTIKGIVQIAEGCEIPPGEYVSDDELLRRVKLVTKNVTSEPRYAKEQEDYDVDVITSAVLETIPNEEIAYQFVLEEIEGASLGNEEARKFAKGSVFLRDEYEDAMSDSSPEVDGYSGPQQTLTRLIHGRLAGSSMDEMARVRIEIVKNIIKHWKLDEQS